MVPRLAERLALGALLGLIAPHRGFTSLVWDGDASSYALPTAAAARSSLHPNGVVSIDHSESRNVPGLRLQAEALDYATFPGAGGRDDASATFSLPVQSPAAGVRQLHLGPRDGYCDNNIPGIQSENVCCPATCGACGGNGCRKRPGGDACCVRAVSRSGRVCSSTHGAPCIILSDTQPTPDGGLCDNGIPGIQEEGVCCPTSCGTCGGRGCRNRPGGNACCLGAARASGIACSATQGAPCIISGVPGVVASPLPAPVPAPLPGITTTPASAATQAPVSETTQAPTQTPVSAATQAPIAAATQAPVSAATQAPTQAPVSEATEAPISAATQAPTQAPVAAATQVPNSTATQAPTQAPVSAATQAPTQAPISEATQAPVSEATQAPTQVPIAAATQAPVAAATQAPTQASISAATQAPVSAATQAPVSAATQAPVAAATQVPNSTATQAPTQAPVVDTTAAPAKTPVFSPTADPTQAPMDFAPTPAPTGLTGSVDVDLVPCILASRPLVKDVSEVASAYLFNEFYKGFWTATQVVQIIGPVDTLDLVYADDPNHGRCGVIYVGIVPDGITPDAPGAAAGGETDRPQKQQLQDYSRKFKVRVVYFDVAETVRDPEVKKRLGVEDRYGSGWQLTGAPRVKRTGGSRDSVVPTDMITVPTTFNRPVEQTKTPVPSGVTVLAQYADEDGKPLPGFSFPESRSAGIVEYIGDDGLEEMHVFLGLAWFDTGSWAWAHFIAEWGSKGIFQGERRFYLGAVNDDLFLSTGQWVYDSKNGFAGEEVRLTAGDLEKFRVAEQSFGSVKTEHAFNGVGILDEVYANTYSPWKSWDNVSSDIALLAKGEPPQDGGIPQVTAINWLSTTFNPAPGVEGIASDIDRGLFENDKLLTYVQANLDAFYWQSHSFSHLARDNLGPEDCLAEDAGNVQMAILLGLFDSDNYNWRSMTSPAITGLFNPNCLQSGADNLMKCYPGDNTWNLANTPISLINEGNQFHSLYTNVKTNGLAGLQIIPRFSTNVYFNCVTGKCLVDKNEKIRRDVCGCQELDPSLPKGSCSSSCTGRDGTVNTQSFNDQAGLRAPVDPKPLQLLFETEEKTTSRYLLSGRRDKYMFHQANLISTEWASDPADPLYVDPAPKDKPSLLEYWYRRVLTEVAKYVNTEIFTIETLKFDNLCHNFRVHEDLDSSGAILIATKDPSGDIIDMTLTTSKDNGAGIPLTVPTSLAGSISLGGLTPVGTETYGADTTFVFAAGTLNSGDLGKPDIADVYQVPQAATAPAQSTSAQDQADAQLAEARPRLEEAARQSADVAQKVADEAGIAAAN